MTKKNLRYRLRISITRLDKDIETTEYSFLDFLGECPAIKKGSEDEFLDRFSDVCKAFSCIKIRPLTRGEDK